CDPPTNASALGSDRSGPRWLHCVHAWVSTSQNGWIRRTDRSGARRQETPMSTELEQRDLESARKTERALAARFQFVSHSAELAARGAPRGRRASAYAKVMS